MEMMLAGRQTERLFRNIERNDCNSSPDRSICLSSFLGFRRRQSRRRNPKNSECEEREKASKINIVFRCNQKKLLKK
jgi:hypothetical protein